MKQFAFSFAVCVEHLWHSPLSWGAQSHLYSFRNLWMQSRGNIQKKNFHRRFWWLHSFADQHSAV